MENIKTFDVFGMSCASCVSRVEKAVKKIDGIENVSVNLLTNSMCIKGNVPDSEIIKNVKKAGYDAKIHSVNQNKTETSDEFKFEKIEQNKLKNRLITSGFFLLVLMYFSMGHMWNFPLPEFLNHNFVALGILQLTLCLFILFENRKFFINGFKSLIKFSPNMDSLVALGSGISFLWSFINLLLMTNSQNSHQKNMEIYKNLYFESSAMIVTLITVGKLLESISKGKTTQALKSLMKLVSKTVKVIKNDEEVEIPIEELKVDDIFLVLPGQNIPVDAVVVEGNSSVDESAITGEGIPVEKWKNSELYSGTLNLGGFLKCKAKKVGKDSTINKIIEIVKNASNSKAPVARVADKISSFFVPSVIFIAVLTFSVWILLGKDFSFAISKAVSVLVISCPCALGLATPVAIMVGTGRGSKSGILFKNAESLEKAGKSEIVCLDKTGTITKGKPEVSEITTFDDFTKEEILSLALTLEEKSEHPLSKAIISKAKELNIQSKITEEFKTFPGRGISGKIENSEIKIGNLEFVINIEKAEKNIVEYKNLLEKFSSQGKSSIFVSKNSKIAGIITVSDTIKEDSFDAIKEFHKLGLEVVMLSGDNQKTAEFIANSLNIDKVFGGLLPEQKSEKIKSLKSKNKKIMMVGDGINDAPAFAVSDIGVAIGSGSDIALESAEIVLVKNSLTDAVNSVKLSQKTLTNIKQNLFWAFIYNVISIPLAAGIFIKPFGLELNPMVGALCMSLSSFCVVTNALRLNFVKLKLENIKIKDKNMKKTYKVTGMMCEHCENHVNSALLKIDGIKSAKANHKTSSVEIEFSKEIDENLIKSAIEEQGYTFG